MHDKRTWESRVEGDRFHARNYARTWTLGTMGAMCSSQDKVTQIEDYSSPWKPCLSFVLAWLTCVNLISHKVTYATVLAGYFSQLLKTRSRQILKPVAPGDR